MKNIGELPKKLFPLLTVFTISVISTWRWISISIFTYSDWQYNLSNTLKDFATLNFSWTSLTGFGQLNLTASSWPSILVFGTFGLLNQNSNVADKFVFMFPVIIFSGLGSFLLLKHLLKSPIPAVVGSFVFTFNTYTLLIKTVHLTILVADSLVPLVILSFIKALEEKRFIWIVAFAILSFIQGAYEFRIFYITASILVLYFIFHTLVIEKGKLKAHLRNTALSFAALVVVALLNMYWVIGLSKSGSVLHNEIFDRGLFGSQYLSLQDALTLFQSFWNGIQPISFLVNPIPIYFWLIPLVASLGLVLNRKNPKVVFFGIIAIIGILLTKQEDAPFSNLYLWMYHHIPGFNAFREASKFYILIALGYSVLIAAFIKTLWEKATTTKGAQTQVWKIGAWLVTISISAIFLWNIKPFITGEIGSLFISRHVPNDYKVFNSMIDSQPGYFRTYWLPTSSRWTEYTNLHPELSGTGISANLKDILPKEDLPLEQGLTSALEQPYSKEMLNNTATKYIVVPLRDEANDDDFFIYYGDNRQLYIDTLNSLPYLKRINIGTKDLAVYENTSFKPYISSPTSLYQTPSTNNLAEIYSFATSQLGENDFNFYTTDSTKNVPSTQITDIFSDLSIKDFQPGVASKTLSAPQGSLLYSSTNRPSLSYQVTSTSCPAAKSKGKPKAPACQPQQNLNITSTNKNLVSLGPAPLPGSGSVSTPILTTKLEPNTTYLLGLDTTPVAVDTTGKLKNLGTIEQPVTLYSQNSPNLIPNPSLENGLWQQTISDCNNYDNRALISMKIDNSDTSDGKNSLQLDADQHTACTGPGQIAVRSGEKYLLNFDYKVHNTKDVEYELDFDDSGRTIAKEQVNAPSDNWRTFSKIVTVPSGATHLNLLVYGIPDEKRQNHATTHYDNFGLTHLTPAAPININLATTFQTARLSDSSQTYSYLDNTFNFQNLIKNPSLEDGLWQQKVGDCNSYDSNPSLGMRLDTTDSTDGQNSLELQARRHTACTGPTPSPVQENQTYRLSFDYSSPNGTQAGYYFSFDDAANTAVSETLPIKDKNWHNFVKYFRVPPGGENFSLTVYSYSDSYGTQNILTRYDNFSLIQAPDIQARYFQVSQPSAATTPPASITYDSANPTLKYVHVSGSTKPFYVAMSEAYHDQWRLELNNSAVNGRLRGWIPWVHPNAIADAQHFKLNDFENGWYVDPAQLCKENPQGCIKNPDGSYNLQMQIEFVPQRWFYLGTLISGLTLIGCLSYILIYGVRKLIRRRKHDLG